MYVIKTIFYDAQCQRVDIRNGLSIKSVEGVENKAKVPQQFWDETYIKFEDGMSFTDLEKVRENERDLSFVSDYKFEEKKFYFVVSQCDLKDKEGYILVVRHMNSKIQTSGGIIYEKYTTNSVVLLHDGDYIEIGQTKIEVINNQLMMHI